MPVRRLILMRHGEAAPPQDSSDHDRPLTPVGRGEAARVGDALVARGWLPDLVRASDSLRTRQTWESLAPKLSAPAGVSFTRDLYLPTLERLVADAAGWAEEAETVLCLGHNPGWSDSTTRLSGVRVGLVTAEAALLEVEGADWSDAFTRRWTLVDRIRP